jgi:hypothetical protein
MPWEKRMKVGSAWRLVREPRNFHATEHRLEMTRACAGRLARDAICANYRILPLYLGAEAQDLVQHQTRPLLAVAVEHLLKFRVGRAFHRVAREDTLDPRDVGSCSNERRLGGVERVGVCGSHRLAPSVG